MNSALPSQRPIEVLKLLTVGVYVVGVRQRDVSNGFTASWISQVSFRPLLVALSINPAHRSYPMICESGGFTINVLARDQLELAARFGRPGEKLEGIDWRPSPHFGAPLLEGILGWMEVEAEEEYRAGDHRLIVGRVIAGEAVREGEPLLYRETGDLDQASELFPERF